MGLGSIEDLVFLSLLVFVLMLLQVVTSAVLRVHLVSPVETVTHGVISMLPVFRLALP